MKSSECQDASQMYNNILLKMINHAFVSVQVGTASIQKRQFLSDIGHRPRHLI